MAGIVGMAVLAGPRQYKDIEDSYGSADHEAASPLAETPLHTPHYVMKKGMSKMMTGKIMARLLLITRQGKIHLEIHEPGIQERHKIISMKQKLYLMLFSCFFAATALLLL